MFKKIISVVLLVSIANSMYLMNAKAENTIYVDGIEFKVDSNEADEAVVYTVMENGDKVYANIDKNSNEIEAEVIDYPVNVVGIGLGKPEITEYELTVEKEKTGETEIQIINTETNESITVDSENDIVEAQDAYVLPQSYSELAKLWPILVALGEIGVIITLIGLTVIVVAGVASYTVEYARKKLPNDKNSRYYKAFLEPNVKVGVDYKSPLTFAQAVKYLGKTGNNIFALSQKEASAACAAASPVGLSLLDGYNDGIAQYKHYHPRTSRENPNSRLGNHCWY